MKQCNRCGEVNAEGVRYCATCGQPTSGEHPSGPGPEAEEPQSSEHVGAPTFGETRSATDPTPPPPVVTGSETVAPPPAATTPRAASPSIGPTAGPVVRSTRSSSLMIATLAVAVVVIIGGIFVLLASDSGRDDVARPGQDSVSPSVTSDVTSDAPQPSAPSADSIPQTSAPIVSLPPTTLPSATAVPTAPSAPLRAPGDLGLTQPILDETCDGRYITFVGSAVGARPYAVEVGELLDAYPGTNYIWTRACPSLRQEFVDGAEIYGVVYGPYATEQEACDARASGPVDAYVRRISTFDPQDHTIGC